MQKKYDPEIESRIELLSHEQISLGEARACVDKFLAEGMDLPDATRVFMEEFAPSP